MGNINLKDKMVNELSKFVHDVQESTNEDHLFDVPFMIKYQLSDEISSTYDIYEENFLEGISN